MRAARWAVLISGRGSNLGALLDARHELDGRFELALVVSSRSDAEGLVRARRAGVPAIIAPKTGKQIDWPTLDSELKRRGVSRILLAGFMRIVAPTFCASWSGRIFNLHPSLLPAYPGLESIERAYNEGSELGLTVHEAVAEIDAGRTIVQRRTFAGGERARRSLADAESAVHRDEQRAVVRAVAALSGGAR